VSSMCAPWGAYQPILLIFDLGQQLLQVVAMACAFSIGIKVFFQNVRIFICSLLMVSIRLLVCHCVVYCRRWIVRLPLSQRIFQWLQQLTGVDILLPDLAYSMDNPASQSIEDITDELRGLIDCHIWSTCIRSYIDRFLSYIETTLPEPLRRYLSKFRSEEPPCASPSVECLADTGSTISHADGEDSVLSTPPSPVAFEGKKGGESQREATASNESVMRRVLHVEAKLGGKSE